MYLRLGKLTMCTGSKYLHRYDKTDCTHKKNVFFTGFTRCLYVHVRISAMTVIRSTHTSLSCVRNIGLVCVTLGSICLLYSRYVCRVGIFIESFYVRYLVQITDSASKHIFDNYC